MTRTRKAVLASSAALVLAGTAAALASGSGHRRAAPPRPGVRATGVAYAPWGGPRVGRPGFAHPWGPPFLGLRAAADYLQIPVATLAADLHSGKTLAQIADSTSGKSASGLVDFLVGKVQSALDEAVKTGRLTQSQEDSIVSMVRKRITAAVNGTFPPPLLRPGHHLGPAVGIGLKGGLQVAADYLQIPVSTLVDDLRSGKTLADVASATPGKSASGLIDALVADEQAALDRAVTSGRLTEARADAIKARLQGWITALVNGAMPGPGRPFAPRFRFGPGHDWSRARDHGGITA
jgi:uncharacterized protein (DUF433 family)